MAVFKVPKITTAQRESLVLSAAEIVFDTDSAVYFGGNDVSMGGFPLGASGGTSNVETFILDSQDITNKKVILSSEPFYPSSVQLTVAGGIQQINGIDFEVVGTELRWDGLGLDNFLEVNDTLIIQF
jgi:hypothetical protein